MLGDHNRTRVKGIVNVRVSRFYVNSRTTVTVTGDALRSHRQPPALYYRPFLALCAHPLACAGTCSFSQQAISIDSAESFLLRGALTNAAPRNTPSLPPMREERQGGLFTGGAAIGGSPAVSIGPYCARLGPNTADATPGAPAKRRPPLQIGTAPSYGVGDKNPED